MARLAFYDAATGVLKAHGFVTTNEPGDLVTNVPDGFDLQPGRWRWDGSAWVDFVPTPPPPPAPSPETILARTRLEMVPAGPVHDALQSVLELVERHEHT